MFRRNRSGPKKILAESQKQRATAAEITARSVYLLLLGILLFGPLAYIHIYAGPDAVILIVAILMVIAVAVVVFLAVMAALTNWRASQPAQAAGAVAAVVKENAKIQAYSQKAALQLDMEAKRQAMRQAMKQQPKEEAPKRRALPSGPRKMQSVASSVDLNSFEVK